MGRSRVRAPELNQLVELAADLVTERRRIGTGERGLTDGTDARFAEPLGLLLLPDAVAAAAGYEVLVADSVNHALRGVSLTDGAVTTVAGTGVQLRTRVATGESGAATTRPPGPSARSPATCASRAT